MPSTLTAVIVDDEPPARDLLRLLCGQAGVAVLGEAADGIAALEMLAQVNPDLVFLDISMPALDGMAVARRLSEKAQAPAIIFTTAHAAHAVTAFDVGAVDYLLKPIDSDRFALALSRVRAARESAQPQAIGERARQRSNWRRHTTPREKHARRRANG